MNETLEMNFLRVRTERDEAIEQRDKYKKILGEFAVAAAVITGALDLRGEKRVPDLVPKIALQEGIDELEACLQKWREMFNDKG